MRMRAILARALIAIVVAVTATAAYLCFRNNQTAAFYDEHARYWYDRIYVDPTTCGRICPTDAEKEYFRKNMYEAVRERTDASDSTYFWGIITVGTAPLILVLWLVIHWVIFGSWRSSKVEKGI